MTNLPTETSGGFPLESGWFSQPPVHIPTNDENPSAYKTELAIVRKPEETIKLLWWHEDDPREQPHNHPWAFVSDILSGGYDEERYWFGTTGSIKSEILTYREGDKNIVETDVFHNVRNVISGTRTKLTCGTAREGNAWEYLDISSGKLILPNELDPNFVVRLRKLNPHLRK